ncbi:MAG: hypothetical protein IPG25_01095 [Proteobacteria bacterium]|nr:hypothetical protein [Pseudomonadota bacterium]
MWLASVTLVSDVTTHGRHVCASLTDIDVAELHPARRHFRRGRRQGPVDAGFSISIDWQIQFIRVERHSGRALKLRLIDEPSSGSGQLRLRASGARPPIGRLVSGKSVCTVD